MIRVDSPPSRQLWRLPLGFEAMGGRTDSRVDFVSRGQGYALFLTSREAVLALARPEVKRGRPHMRLKSAAGELSPTAPPTVVRLQWWRLEFQRQFINDADTNDEVRIRSLSPVNALE